MAAGLKLSIKGPLGQQFKVKGTNPDKVADLANNMRDMMPKPVELPNDSLPRALRTSVPTPSIPKKFRFRGSMEK